jgi:hypothetical protein
VLGDLVDNMLGAEESEQAGVGGRYQRRALAMLAGVQNVIPQPIGVSHNGLRREQEVG